MCFLLTFTQFAQAQCPITDPDLSIACGSSTILTAAPVATDYNPVAGVCTPAVIAGTNAFPVAVDDDITTPIPMGFPFSFYGNTYTDIIIGTNGLVGFGGFNYTSFISVVIPSAGQPNNYIAGFYADIDIRCGGSITYATIGTAPNRSFVVYYNNVRPFSGNFPVCGGVGTGTASFQIIINENGSFQLLMIQLSANWFATSSIGALATQGTENSNGTIAQPVIIPYDRNNTDWPGIADTGTGPADCQTFTPYTRAFKDWRVGSATGLNIASNPTNTVTVSPTATTTYYASWEYTGQPLCTDPITVTVVQPTLTFNSQSNNTTCIAPYNGNIVFNTNFGAGTYTMNYSRNGTATSASVVVAGGVATLTGLDAGSYTNFSFPVPAGCTAATVAGPYTITNTNSAPTSGVGVSICTGATATAMTSGIIISPTIAQGATFNSGALATTDPTWVRNLSGSCTASGVGTNTYYDVFPFTVSTSGSYNFAMCTPGANWDGFGSLYQTNFTPTALCTNYVNSDDDGNSGGNCNNDALMTNNNLTAGTTYYLITTSFSNVTTGAYSWTYTGPSGATISAGSSSVPQWYTTATGGSPLATTSTFNPVGFAGSGIINNTTATTVTYYLAFSNAPTCRQALIYTISAVSTAPTPVSPLALNCPNTDIILTYSGGVAGAGSSVKWYTGANGTGTLLGTDVSITVAPVTTTTYYIRREGGTCGNSADASVVVNVRTFNYTTTATTASTTFCTDNGGWNHFYTASNEIIFSVKGNIGLTSTATVALKLTAPTNYYQTANGTINCAVVAPPNERFEMRRSWNFTLGSTTPTGTYDVRFYYVPVERTDIETAANAWRTNALYTACGYAYKYNAGAMGFSWFKNTTGAYSAPQYDGLQLTGTVSSITGVNYVELTGLTSFSGGSGAVTLIPITPLPVTLVDFSGKRMTNTQVKLNWQTVQEVNSLGFDVEYAQNARDFEKIGFVFSQGNDKTLANYESLHNNTTGGYFRLKQIDKDGKFNYSKIVYIAGTTEASVLVYPNPAQDKINIELGELKATDEVRFVLRNMLGVEVSKNIINQTKTEVNVEPFAKGIYILEIIKNGKRTIKKIVLQ